MKTKKHQYALDDVLNFGKYRHSTIRSIIEHDEAYLKWCITSIPNFTLTDAAWEYAISLNASLRGLKPIVHYDYEPYSEGVEILLTFPWKKRFIAYMRKYAEDVVFYTTNCIHKKQTIQLQIPFERA